MHTKLVLRNGLALFAMFFGCGNIIYPLTLGANQSDHLVATALTFILAAVGIPFLGLFAAGLKQGDYFKFFAQLGKVPSFLLITFLVLFLGPFFAAPRSETVAFNTLVNSLPNPLNQSLVFNALYSILCFLLIYKQQKIVNIIGYLLSPTKITLFLILFMLGMLIAPHYAIQENELSAALQAGILNGYSTMDLIAAFFFCRITAQDILQHLKQDQKDHFAWVYLKSCLIAGFLLSILYLCFMLLAARHSALLQNSAPENIIFAIANTVLGAKGAIFIGICVLFACLVTSISLLEVTTDFFHRHLFREALPRTTCLIITITIAFSMSEIGFSTIMALALPLLEILYPLIIAYTIIQLIPNKKRWWSIKPAPAN